MWADRRVDRQNPGSAGSWRRAASPPPPPPQAAVQSHVRPSSAANWLAPVCNTVVVGGFDQSAYPWSFQLAEDKLVSLFSRCGHVQRIELPAEDARSNPPRRLKHPQVAIVHYNVPAEAAAAVTQFHGQVLFGQRLTVRLQSTPAVEAVSRWLFVSGFKDARWSFDFATSQLGDWFRSAGFPVESIDCPGINGKAEPMPHAYFAFVGMPSEEAAQNAKNKLNMTKLDVHTIVIDFKLEDRPIADPAAVKEHDRNKPVCRGNPIIKEMQGGSGPEGQTLRAYAWKFAIGKQNQHHCPLARQMWQYAQHNKLVLYTGDFMNSGRVHLYPSMVEANTAACLKSLGDMVQQVCTFLSQEGSSMGEFILAFWTRHQWAFVQRYCLSQVKLLSSKHHIALEFRRGQVVVHGMKKNIVAPQVEEVIKAGLGIRSEDWCNRTVTILEEQVSPVALRELSYPAQLEAFEHKAVQDAIKQAEALGQVLLVQNASKLKPGVMDAVHIWGLDQQIVDKAAEPLSDMINKLSHSMLSVPMQQRHLYTAAAAGMTTEQGFIALMAKAQQSVLIVGVSATVVQRGLTEFKQAVNGLTLTQAVICVPEDVAFELQRHHQRSMDSVGNVHDVTCTCTSQDGKACITLAGEQRRLLAARDALSSLLKAIKDNITTEWLQLQAWESAVFKQQALATIGSDMMADIRSKHGVWCAVDVQVGPGTAADVDGAQHTQASQPQEALHATAQVHGHIIEVVQGNLVKQDVDAVVNAANQHLQHSGGVARALAQAAGPALAAECAALLSDGARFPSGCVPVASAVKTGAGAMPCRAIIHAVAPKYAGGANGEDAQLQQAVAMAMDIACVEKMGSIALPLIGTGVFGNPTGMAAKVHVAQVLASLNTLGSRCPGVLQIVKFVEIDVDKCKALASELLRQTRSTPHQGQSLPLPPNVAVVQDANDYVNGHAWGVYIKQKKLEIAYGVDVSCALERQYMRFNQLGSAEKDQSPLRYKDEVFDSEEHKAGTGYRVDLLKLEQMNIQSKYSRPIWRRSVAPTPTPPGQRSRPTSAASVPSTAIQGLNVNASAAQGEGGSGPSHPAGPTSRHVAVDAAATVMVFKGRKSALSSAKQALQSMITARQREDEMDLGGHMPTPEEMMNIKQAESMFNVQVTELGSGCVKVLGDIGTLQQVQQHMQVVMSERHMVRWPDHWAPQSTLVEVFNVPLNSAEAAPLLAGMQGEGQVVKVERIQNRKLYQHYSGYRSQVQERWGHIPDLDVEKHLWHGSGATDPSLIYTDEYGFRLNFAAQGMWGRGCYFSVPANLSCRDYPYRLPADKAVAYGGKAVLQVMLVKVLVGAACHLAPDKSLKIPPFVSDIPQHLRQQGITQLRYESVSGVHPSLGGTPIYITYNLGHGYPEYLITFTKSA